MSTARTAGIVFLLILLQAVPAATLGRLPAPEGESASQKVHPPDVPPQDQEILLLEESTHLRINAIRREHGLDPLESDSALDRIARAHSRRMSTEEFFAHTDPDGEGVDDRLRGAGISYRRVGENISMSVNVPDPVEQAVAGWMKSPGHRENILHPDYTHSGIGIWRNGRTYHFTQVFHRPL